MQNGDKGMTSIILAGPVFLVKMLITLELHGISCLFDSLRPIS